MSKLLMKNKTNKHKSIEPKENKPRGNIRTKKTEEKKVKKQKIIGFAGSDKAEIIHYISRVLCVLKKKVLLIDVSETRALSYSVASVSNIDVIDYRGIDITTNENIKTDGYDFVYIDFGFNLFHSLISSCDTVVLVTDLQIHNIKRLLPLKLRDSQERYMLIKDIVKGKIGKKYVMNELSSFAIESANCLEVFYDEKDLKTMLNCQYNQVFSFRKISWELKKVVITLSFSNINNKETNKAFKLAEGGR